MDPDSRPLAVVAGAITELRGARDPAARVEAVRTAAGALQELTNADRQVLAQELLAHGAPAAGRLLADRADGRLPADDVVAVAQDLLALAPVQVAQLADQLEEAVASGPAAALTATEPAAGNATPSRDAATSASTGPGTADGPPPVPAAARRSAGRRPTSHRSGPTAASRSATSTAHRAASTSVGRPTRGAPEDQRPSSRSVPDPDGWARAQQLAREPSPRARRQTLAADDAFEPLDVDTLLQVLAEIPDGWQRRVALRRVLTVAPVDVGARGHELLELFSAPGDRFAVAALLLRCGLASVAALTASLEPRAARRLEARAARAAR